MAIEGLISELISVRKYATMQLKGSVSIVCVEGQVWLSIPSSTGPRSVCPLVDILLRAGQSYRAVNAIVSSFEDSVIRVDQTEKATIAAWKTKRHLRPI
jgi:hypothetical protein